MTVNEQKNKKRAVKKEKRRERKVSWAGMKCKRTNFLRQFLSFFSCLLLTWNLSRCPFPPFFSFSFWSQMKSGGSDGKEVNAISFSLLLSFLRWRLNGPAPEKIDEGKERRRVPGLSSCSFPPKNAKLCSGLSRIAETCTAVWWEWKRRFPLIFDFFILDTKSVHEFGWSLSETLKSVLRSRRVATRASKN